MDLLLRITIGSFFKVSFAFVMSVYSFVYLTSLNFLSDLQLRSTVSNPKCLHYLPGLNNKMQKLKLPLQSQFLLLPSRSHNYHSEPIRQALFFITSLSILSPNSAYSSASQLSPKNSILFDYFIGSLKFSQIRAIAVSHRFQYAKSLEKPEAVVRFFKAIGFSDTQIHSSAHSTPVVFFVDVEKNLNPKVMFFQELGLSGPQLCKFISKNPKILTGSLDGTLKPCIFLIKKVLQNDDSDRSIEKVNHELFQILARCSTILRNKSRLESNISYLQSCGVLGSQLSKLLVRQSRIFTLLDEKLMQLVSRAVDMGFIIGSRMFVHGVNACLNSANTFNRKHDLFLSYGFSRYECSQMFFKAPTILRSSDKKLRCAMQFFLHKLMLNKSVIVGWPICLTLDMEKRVIPRCRIMEIIKSRRLLEREPSICSVLCLKNEKFVERYILRFIDDSEELRAAYEGHLLK